MNLDSLIPGATYQKTTFGHEILPHKLKEGYIRRVNEHTVLFRHENEINIIKTKDFLLGYKLVSVPRKRGTVPLIEVEGKYFVVGYQNEKHLIEITPWRNSDAQSCD